jgi:hypothetical protein
VRLRRRTLPSTKTPPDQTAIVVAAVGSFAFARRAGVSSFNVTGKVVGTPTPTPTVERSDGAVHPPVRSAFLGSGSWVMSSLPDCFRERELIRGPVAELRAKFPPTTERVRPPGVVLSGECTVYVRSNELLIVRGADRLRVPPQAMLYRNAAGLTLVYIHGGHAEIRRY